MAVLLGGYFGTWMPRLGRRRPSLSSPPRSVRPVPAWDAAWWGPPGDVCGLAESARVARWLADQTAGQCGPCVNGLVPSPAPRPCWWRATTRLAGQLGTVVGDGEGSGRLQPPRRCRPLRREQPAGIRTRDRPPPPAGPCPAARRRVLPSPGHRRDGDDGSADRRSGSAVSGTGCAPSCSLSGSARRLGLSRSSTPGPFPSTYWTTPAEPSPPVRPSPCCCATNDSSRRGRPAARRRDPNRAWVRCLGVEVPSVDGSGTFGPDREGSIRGSILIEYEYPLKEPLCAARLLIPF